MADNRNMILAIALSLIVLLGWQFLVVNPQMEQQRLAEEARQAQVAAQTPAPAAGDTAGGTAGGTTAGAVAGATPPASATAVASTREAAVAASPRVAIDTPALSGSLNLRGARIDDLALKGYRVTVDPGSPNVTLLSPAGGPDAYFAEFGFVGAPGVTVPNGDTVWSAPAGARLTPDTPLTLTFDNGQGLVFTRTIAVDERTMFTVTDAVANGGDAPATVHPYGFVMRHGTPKVEGTYILHEGLIGFLGEDGLQEVDYSQIAEEREIKPGAVNAGWLGITDKYWATALVPVAKEGADFQPRFLHARVGEVDTYQADYLRDALTVAPGASVTTEARLFAGAKEVRKIDDYETSLGIDRFDLMIDWGWFYFLTKPMFYLIDFLFRMVGNFGVAILLVTVIIKGVFFPLANKSYSSMSKMKKVQPEMTELRERFKDDKAKQQQAMMELYKREKINPLAGCLPILVQIPVFFALYKVLYVTIEMRHAPFFGWIQDLSAPDPTSLFNLFGLIPWNPPAFLLIGVWPLIMGITMFLQMKLNPTPTDPTQAAVFTWMPVIFTFMLGTFPAGLVIYWAWNNTLSIAQQATIMHRQGVKIELWDNLKATFSRKGAGTSG
jgi:YidC/Oxa1 family membrane protein insertase